jgi:hypothetical protein
MIILEIIVNHLCHKFIFLEKSNHLELSIFSVELMENSNGDGKAFIMKK